MSAFLPTKAGIAKKFKSAKNTIARSLSRSPKSNAKQPPAQETSRKYQEPLLADISLKDCETFRPSVEWAKVVKVYDGDTITIAVIIGEKPYKFSTRLNGIDTPEMRGKSVSEKTKAIEARDFLKGKIFGEMVQLTNVEYDKYGRLLADIFHEERNISQMMLDNGYAVAYDGGKKTKVW